MPRIICVDIAMRPVRSRRIAAIGASKTGGRSTVMPGSASRNPFTQATSRNRRIDLPERQQDADHEHADDQAVEAGIGEERRDDLLVEDDGEQAAENEKDQHPHEENSRRGEFIWVECARHCLRASLSMTKQTSIWHRRRQIEPGRTFGQLLPLLKQLNAGTVSSVAREPAIRAGGIEFTVPS